MVDAPSVCVCLCVCLCLCVCALAALLVHYYRHGLYEPFVLPDTVVWARVCKGIAGAFTRAPSVCSPLVR